MIIDTKSLIHTLESNFDPNEKLLVLFYNKEEFENDVESLTDDQWIQAIQSVDQDSADQLLSEQISEAVCDYGTTEGEE